MARWVLLAAVLRSTAGCVQLTTQLIGGLVVQPFLIHSLRPDRAAGTPSAPEAP